MRSFSLGLKRYFRPPRGKKYSIESSPLTSSHSMILAYLLFFIALLALAPPLTSILLPPLSPSCCSWGFLDLGSDHLPVLVTISFSPVFCPNEPPPFFKFQKTRWHDSAYNFDSHCLFAEKSSSFSLSLSLSLFPLLLLSLSRSR